MATLITKYKSYPAYKPSGVQWLDEIPAHWEVKRLKYVCSLAGLYGANIPASLYSNEGVRFIRTTDISDDGQLTSEGVLVPEELVQGYILKNGDILLSRSGTIGRSFLYEQSLHGPCAYAGYLVRFVLNERANPQYIALYTRSTAFEGYVRSVAISSTIDNVNADKYSNSLAPLPPLPEQQAIAVYLDRETARIDALVSKNELLMELLREKRTALITHAVTRGLDPNAPMKDSGVEWLGEIPAHWEVRRLKYVATLNPKASEVRKLAPDTAVSFVPMEAIGEYGGLDLSQARDISDVADSYTYFSDGDVLVAKITPCFENGKGSLAEGLVNGVAFGTTELHVLRCGTELDKHFAFYLTLTDTFRKLGEAEMYGAGGQKRVPESFVTNLKHPIPPLPEQQAIAPFLDRETAKLDALVARVREAIGCLKELRTAIISAAVTGRIDVREETA